MTRAGTIRKLKRTWKGFLKLWDWCTKWMDRLKTIGFIITITAVLHDLKTGKERDTALLKVANISKVDSIKCNNAISDTLNNKYKWLPF